MSFITCQQPDKHCPFILLSTHEARMWRQVYTSGWDTCSINTGTNSEVWLPHPDTRSNWAWQLVEHGIRGRLSRKSSFQELAGVKILGYTQQEFQISRLLQASTNDQGTSSSKLGVRDHSIWDPDPRKVSESQFYRGRFFFFWPHVRGACTKCVNINWFD